MIAIYLIATGRPDGADCPAVAILEVFSNMDLVLCNISFVFGGLSVFFVLCLVVYHLNFVVALGNVLIFITLTHAEI
ncbi:hypothetical protein [Pseudomonas glycinae]|uniref:hypothetical protein n=1 Tax=Pseudomonas glycinae TaxID=1785145 RepID=UPI001F2BBE98|nr:hypothetical protein [Pseudomonas glycinae]